MPEKEYIKGSLYVVATPIGNLKDITIRALDVLKEVDIIACEDTRHTKKLLTHYDIPTKLVSYHEHNEVKRTQEVLGMLKDGFNVAIVSDAGTPVVSDPGYVLISEALKEGYRIVPIPGATAFLPALILSGISNDKFTFCGFLERKASKRREQLAELKMREDTLIFYEAPHRIVSMLEDVKTVLGDRRCAAVKEITKLHEKAISGTVSEVVEVLGAEEIKGEFVVVVEGIMRDYEGKPKREHVNKYSEFSKAIDKESK